MINLKMSAISSLVPNSSFNINTDGSIYSSNSAVTDLTETEIQTEMDRLQAEYNTTQPLKLLREERDKKLREEVDPKTCEAYNNETQLSNDWKNYRQALLDMTLQTPTLDENGNLKAGLELDEIYWPTKPE